MNLLMKQSSVIAVAVLLITGCAGSGTPIPAPQSAAAQLFVEKCGTCHAVPHPARHSAEEWPHYVALMEQRMAERDKPPLNEPQRQLILEYLSEHGR